MGLVHVDTPKVEMSRPRRTQKRREPWSVCRQTFEKLDQNNCLKWLKAANKCFKRCHKVLVCRSVLRCSNLQFFVQHGGRPSAFRQKSAECHTETNSSFQIQTIRDIHSNHHVHWFVFGRTHLFFRNADPSCVSFLKEATLSFSIVLELLPRITTSTLLYWYFK